MKNSRFTAALPTGRPASPIRPDHLIEDGVVAARGAIERKIDDLETYARNKPREALFAAAFGGYVLRTLPLARITGGLIRLALLLVKPAAAFYLGSRVWGAAMGGSVARNGDLAD